MTDQHVLHAAGTGVLLRKSLVRGSSARERIGCGLERFQINLLLTYLE